MLSLAVLRDELMMKIQENEDCNRTKKTHRTWKDFISYVRVTLFDSGLEDT